jgi:uncharacterized protein YggE
LFQSSPGVVSLQESFNMITKRTQSISMKSPALPAVALFLLSSCIPAKAQNLPDPFPSPEASEQGTIQVTGQSRVSVPADLVRITFTVETEAKTARDATAQNAVEMESVVEAVRALQIPELDFETFGYGLYPEYEMSRGNTGVRSISGYRAQNTLRITVPDVDETGRVLDAAVSAGANRVANLNFEASDTREARLTALREAVSSAREQATTIAAAMGVELGIALEIQGGANAPSPMPAGGMMYRAMAETTTPIEAGNQTVSASVTVKFRISEGGR